MRILIEALLFGVGGIFSIGFVGYYLRSKMQPSTPDKCPHKRWSPWTVEQQVPIHIYSQVDEGVSLPDRVDVYMTRVCRSCGLPQAKTIRGIDSQHNK